MPYLLHSYNLYNRRKKIAKKMITDEELKEKMLENPDKFYAELMPYIVLYKTSIKSMIKSGCA